jgi:hypothetical protein
MSGYDTSVKDGLRTAHDHRDLILKWAAVQFLVGAATKVVQYLAGDSLAGAIVSALAGVVGAAWSVATFFVIPVLTLERLGPVAAMKRSVSLVRERWGEGLVGSAAIGLAVFAVAAIPLALLLNASVQLIDINKAVGATVLALTVIAFIATMAMGSALGVIFRVELYRYATEGELGKGFAQRDMIAAFKPTGPAIA